MKSVIAVYTLLFIGCCTALNVSQCPNARKPIENLGEKVKVGACRKPPCRLRKNTNVEVELKVKTEKDVPKVINSVQAHIVGVPFPFPGVDQTNACENIYKADGVTKNGCPLKAGEEYIYKNSFEVLQIYPRLKTTVHYGITGPEGDLICFEVPARITN